MSHSNVLRHQWQAVSVLEPPCNCSRHQRSFHHDTTGENHKSSEKNCVRWNHARWRSRIWGGGGKGMSISSKVEVQHYAIRIWLTIGQHFCLGLEAGLNPKIMTMTTTTTTMTAGNSYWALWVQIRSLNVFSHQGLLLCFGQHALLFQRSEKRSQLFLLDCPISAQQKQCALAEAASTTPQIHAAPQHA